MPTAISFALLLLPAVISAQVFGVLEVYEFDDSVEVAGIVFRSRFIKSAIFLFPYSQMRLYSTRSSLYSELVRKYGLSERAKII